MYQPAPGKPYVEPSITIDIVQLPITKQLKYLDSVLSNEAQMDEDIKAKISKASSALLILALSYKDPQSSKPSPES